MDKRGKESQALKMSWKSPSGPEELVRLVETLRLPGKETAHFCLLSIKREGVLSLATNLCCYGTNRKTHEVLSSPTSHPCLFSSVIST